MKNKLEIFQAKHRTSKFYKWYYFSGDIDIVAGMGDSVTVGTAANAVNLLEIFIENRGVSFSAGGLSHYTLQFE